MSHATYRAQIANSSKIRTNADACVQLDILIR